MPTDAEIFDAANALKAQSNKVTQAAIREHLKGGSFTTIGPILSRWRKEQADQENAAQHLQAAPEELKTKGATLTDEIWTLAQKMAETRLTAETEALAKKEASLIQDRDEMSALADQFVAENEALQANLTKSQNTVSTLTEAMRTAETNLQKATSTAEAFSASLTDTQNELDTALTKAREARETIASLNGQIETLTQQNDALLNRLDRALGADKA